MMLGFPRLLARGLLVRFLDLKVPLLYLYATQGLRVPFGVLFRGY